MGQTSFPVRSSAHDAKLSNAGNSTSTWRNKSRKENDMAKTYRRQTYHHGDTWGKPGKGKHHKRAYNKAMRRAFKGTGKGRTVARLASELARKAT
jgi:hypothetical protein